jgi:formylglycine-generating enzyme required for sulfatase activity
VELEHGPRDAEPLHDERLAQLIATARKAIGGPADASLVRELVQALEKGTGTGRQRLALGEVLGLLGDPRLHRPSEAAYWVTVPGDQGAITIGRFPVTTAEYMEWAESGYRDRAAWSDEGWTWLQGITDPWLVHARQPESAPFVVPNQPVVGVTYWEAQAYATASGARLPRQDERVWVVRGKERRPYPWGSPFGEGNANTREEVLGRPTAVGLFLRDRTPEGVRDLAGNAAEWLADEVGEQRIVHPGGWDQPSMAAWAKAIALYPPDTRRADLGFRLAMDVPGSPSGKPMGEGSPDR